MYDLVACMMMVALILKSYLFIVGLETSVDDAHVLGIRSTASFSLYHSTIHSLSLIIYLSIYHSGCGQATVVF